MQPVAARAGITLHPCRVAVTPPLAQVDMTRLRQALLNLLSNAIKYNRPGGEVFIDVAEDGDWLSIAVRDTGHGFDTEQARQLFQPFTRLQPHAKLEGTGIGLALTRQLLELMGGRIEARGEPGIGATFTIYLRRVRPSL